MQEKLTEFVCIQKTSYTNLTEQSSEFLLAWVCRK
jgi:hypothetical protein